MERKIIMTHNLNLGFKEIRTIYAKLVRCPDCGQMEVWSLDEYLAHGMCRTYPIFDTDGKCPVCGDEIYGLPDDAEHT
jgi:predicted RNA-binding Zn-ribbon protein involved in translation (DUF1610 family)